MYANLLMKNKLHLTRNAFKYRSRYLENYKTNSKLGIPPKVPELVSWINKLICYERGKDNKQV